MKKKGNPIPLGEAAKLAGVTSARMRQLCSKGRIPGAQLIRGVWMVPRHFTITRGTRGPKRSGAHRAPAPAVKESRTPAAEQWRIAHPQYAKAYNEAISIFEGEDRIKQKHFYWIKQKLFPERRGKGRGENRDALSRSPTGGWFVEGAEGGKEEVRSLDDPLYDPEGEDHARYMYDGSGDTGKHPAQDAPARDDEAQGDLAQGDGGQDDEAQDDDAQDDEDQDQEHKQREDVPRDEQDHAQGSKAGVPELADPSRRGWYDDGDYYLDVDEDEVLDEHVKRIREYVRSGAALTSEIKTGYPLLDAMRELGIADTREGYLRIYCKMRHGTKATDPLPALDDSILPPIFRRIRCPARN